MHGADTDARLRSTGKLTRTVNLREETIISAVNGWIGQLFHPTSGTNSRRLLGCSTRPV